MSDKLIVFYSRADENYVNGLIKTLEVGNTEVAAGIIQELTGADSFKIQQLKPYASNYNECIAQAQADQRQNARPELKSYPETLDGYDVVYLGYPNYWSTMPMAVFTFLEHFDFSGKQLSLSAPMRAAVWAAVSVTSKSSAPRQRLKRGLLFTAAEWDSLKKDIEKWILKDCVMNGYKMSVFPAGGVNEALMARACFRRSIRNTIVSQTEGFNMTKVTAGREELGEFAPKFARLNDDVLFGEVWAEEDKLSARTGASLR